MKLSKHDKSMISMSWLTEIIVNGIIETSFRDVPESKKKEYEKLLDKYVEVFDIISEINSDFHSEIIEAFGYEFFDTIVDLTMMISLLYVGTEPQKLLNDLRLMLKGRHINEHIKKFIESIDAKEKTMKQET